MLYPTVVIHVMWIQRSKERLIGRSESPSGQRLPIVITSKDKWLVADSLQVVWDDENQACSFDIAQILDRFSTANSNESCQTNFWGKNASKQWAKEVAWTATKTARYAFSANRKFCGLHLGRIENLLGLHKSNAVHGHGFGPEHSLGSREVLMPRVGNVGLGIHLLVISPCRIESVLSALVVG